MTQVIMTPEPAAGPTTGPAAGTAPTGTAPTPPATARLRWLDALRAIAVLAVLYEHACTYVAPGVKQFTNQWVHAGTFGVFLFFLVSGYIVPASIERRGSVRDFWIGRIFRLYPAFLVTIALAALVAKLGVNFIPPALREHTATTLLAHSTMLAEALNAEVVQHQFWTLSSEMLFYVFVAVLFSLGLHRLSAEIAMLLAVAALVLGPLLPARLLSSSPLALRNLTVVTTLVLVAGVVALCCRRRGLRLLGVVLLSGLMVSLLGLNQPEGAWEGFIILAVMFVGTAIYRAEQGQIEWSRAGWALLSVAVVSVFCVYQYGDMWKLIQLHLFPEQRAWLGALALAGLFFAAGMALRHRAVPGWLSWLGAVSYSFYLLHFLVLVLFSNHLRGAWDEPMVVRAALTVGYLSTALVVSWACYRWVELPFQSLGRRIIERLPATRSAAAVERR